MTAFWESKSLAQMSEEEWRASAMAARGVA